MPHAGPSPLLHVFRRSSVSYPALLPCVSHSPNCLRPDCTPPFAVTYHQGVRRTGQPEQVGPLKKSDRRGWNEAASGVGGGKVILPVTAAPERSGARQPLQAPDAPHINRQQGGTGGGGRNNSN